MRRGARRSLWLALERLAARSGELTIAASAAHRSIAIRDRVDTPERILTIADGVSPEQHATANRGAIRHELGFPAGARLIGALLTLEPGHGCEALLQRG